jgi:SOS-response transcriptional repressor LexA
MDETINSEFLYTKNERIKNRFTRFISKEFKKIKKRHEISEIEEHLIKNIDDYINNSITILENNDLEENNDLKYEKLSKQEIKDEYNL